WAVFGLSIGAISLLLVLIRRGAVAGVASLLFLVPPCSAVMAYVLFGETLAPVQMLGMAVAAAGVALASRG
ncbi:MAG: EamA/RhaT family transporter, partial [Gammaproteobacteria bacterium]